MSAATKPKLTVAQYLAIERQNDFKSEFYRGEMFAMAGASREHNRIKSNLDGELYARLKGGPCQSFSGDLRVAVDRTGLYTYPDIVIVCGEPEYSPEDRDTLTNPQVIIEILSPSTEGYDRGAKFRNYQQLRSLREYVLVSQDQVAVDHFVRQPDGTWVLTFLIGPDSEFALATVDARIPLRDIYANVDFQPPQTA